MTSHASRLLAEYENKLKIKSKDTTDGVYRDNCENSSIINPGPLTLLDINVLDRYKQILESVYDARHTPLINAYITDLKNDKLTWYYRNTLLSISVKEKEMKYKGIIKGMNKKYKVCKAIKKSTITACYCHDLLIIRDMFKYTSRYIICDYCNNK